MDRYIRQSKSLPNIVEKTALVVGCGGLGSHVAEQLVRMGVNVVLVDHDRFESSNLHRVSSYVYSDVGGLKAINLHSRLVKIANGRVSYFAKTFGEFVEANYRTNRFDIVMDCTDNMEVRYEIESFCQSHKFPFVYGAVNAKSGMVMLFPHDGVSFSDFFGRELKTPDDAKRPATKVFPPAVAIVASLQVSEAVKYLNGDNPSQALYAVNLDTYAIQKQIEF